MEAIKMQLPDALQESTKQMVKDALSLVISETQEKESYPAYMNQRLAAKYLHVAPATLIKWEKKYKDFPVIVLDGIKRYKKASLDKWMHAKER